MEQIIHVGLIFLIQFLAIFFSLASWVLIIWVIISWLVMFRAMRPDNPGFHIFTQLAQPLLWPFRWARVGMIDLSPLVAILFFGFVERMIRDFLMQFL